MKHRLNRDSAVKAAFLLTGSTYTTYALMMLVGAIIARDLGPAEYGRYAYVVWLSGWLVIVANHGLNTSGIRFIAESLGRGVAEVARDIHGWLVRWQRLSMTTVIVLFVVTCQWLQPEHWENDMPMLLSVVVITVIGRTHYLFDISIAKGYGAFYVEAYSTMVVGILNTVAVAVLALYHASLAAYLMLFALTSLGLYAMSAVMLRRAHIRPGEESLSKDLAAQIGHHLRWTITLVTASQLGSKSVETFLLNELIGPKEVGYFTIAAGLTRGGTDLLTVGLSTVLMPTMGRAFGEGGSARVHVIFWDSLRYFFCFGLLLAGVGAFWSSAAITLLYGSQYQQVIPVLQAMTIIGGLTLGEAAFGSLLSTTGKQSVWAKISLLSLLLTLVFAIAFIPSFGLAGAVACYACTRALVFLALVIASMRVQRISLPFGALARLSSAALLAAGVALPIAIFVPAVAGDLIAGGVYLLTYLALMVVFKAWGKSHLHFLMAVSGRLPRLLGWSLPLLQTWHDRFTA